MHSELAHACTKEFAIAYGLDTSAYEISSTKAKQNDQIILGKVLAAEIKGLFESIG
jgi:hypothetical protein